MRGKLEREGGKEGGKQAKKGPKAAITEILSHPLQDDEPYRIQHDSDGISPTWVSRIKGIKLVTAVMF